MIRMSWRRLGRFIGVETNKTSHIERLVSGVSTCFAITMVAIITQWSLPHSVPILFYASAAASAFLIFVLPHGALSQPWPVFAGQILATMVGVAFGYFIGSDLTTAAMGVGLTIILMHYLRCLHPPGAATVFYFVMHFPEIPLHQSVFVFLINIIMILCLALIINNLFSWRRYPLYWFNKRSQVTSKPATSMVHFDVEDLHRVLQQQDTFIDVSLGELQDIYEAASKMAQQRH